MAKADQIALVEQVELQVTGIRKLGDGAALECRDPVDAVELGHRIDLHIRDHAAIAGHDEPFQPEVLARLLDLRQQRFGIADVDVEHRHRDGAAALIRHQTVVDLQRAGPAVAAVAELGQRARHAFEPARRQIEQHETAGLQVTLRKPLLDLVLARDQPIHRGVELVLLRVGKPQVICQRRVGPRADHAELARLRCDDAPRHHRHHEIALTARFRVDELVEAEPPHRRGDGRDVAVMLRGDTLTRSTSALPRTQPHSEPGNFGLMPSPAMLLSL